MLTINQDDEIVRETLVTHEGKIVNPRVAQLIEQEGGKLMNYEFGLYVFMLAAFLGFELIRKVSPLLHTPLMSLTNAIASISVVGADSDQWREGRLDAVARCWVLSRWYQPPRTW